VRFGWDGSLTIEGKAVTLDNYPRWDKPYAHVEFGAEMFHVDHHGQSLNLDFQAGLRNVQG